MRDVTRLAGRFGFSVYGFLRQYLAGVAPQTILIGGLYARMRLMALIAVQSGHRNLVWKEIF